MFWQHISFHRASELKLELKFQYTTVGSAIDLYHVTRQFAGRGKASIQPLHGIGMCREEIAECAEP